MVHPDEGSDQDTSPARHSPRATSIRILVVGAGTPNADYVAKVLSEHGVSADWTTKLRYPNPLNLRRYNIVYGIYLQSCSRYILAAKMLRKKTIVHFVGSDAYWYSREHSIWRRIYWRLVLHNTDLILYVSPHLEQMVRRSGRVLPFPIRTDGFKESELREIQPERDLIYYCPSGAANEKVYQLSWIVKYAHEHPDEKITILGNESHPANYKIQLPNVEVLPFVPQSEMPQLYRNHKRLIRMTTEDGLPRMIHEAFLAGLEVIFNGNHITHIPLEREPEEFSRAFLAAIGSLDPTPKK